MALHPHFLFRDLFRRKNKTRTDLETHLRENVLFCKLDDRELRYLSTLVYERVYEPGEAVFTQGDRGVGMYMIVSGAISIKTQSSPQSEVLVTQLGEGSFFGELALIEPDTLRTATATAVDKTMLIGFFKPDLMEVLNHRPDMGVKILLQLSTILGQRLIESTEKITFLSNVRKISEVYGDAV